MEPHRDTDIGCLGMVATSILFFILLMAVLGGCASLFDK